MVLPVELIHIIDNTFYTDTVVVFVGNRDAVHKPGRLTGGIFQPEQQILISAGERKSCPFFGGIVFSRMDRTYPVFSRRRQRRTCSKLFSSHPLGGIISSVPF